MKKRKEYRQIRFSPEVIRAAAAVFTEKVDSKNTGVDFDLTATVGDEDWTYDTEDEFFADYRRGASYAEYTKILNDGRYTVVFSNNISIVSVRAKERHQIQAVFEVFEANLAQSQLPPSQAPTAQQPPVIFVGHGRNRIWRDLKDHLQDKHRYRVEAYEIGARAGHAVRDVLEDMLSKSSMAFLVMTAEDETAEGGMRARQNVIHEVGLFQGRLGFSRAIILLEEGAEEFSNIHGIDQIRFSKGNIKETFGDVLATIRREFLNEE